jgi:hypothetical protein
MIQTLERGKLLSFPQIFYFLRLPGLGTEPRTFMFTLATVAFSQILDSNKKVSGSDKMH